MDALMYKNLFSLFFVDKTLIENRQERLKKCLEYVKSVKNYSPADDLNKVTKSITSLEVTFMKRWRESNFDEERFTQQNEKWIHKVLEVHIFLKISI